MVTEADGTATEGANGGNKGEDDDGPGPLERPKRIVKKNLKVLGPNWVV